MIFATLLLAVQPMPDEIPLVDPWADLDTAQPASVAASELVAPRVSHPLTLGVHASGVLKTGTTFAGGGLALEAGYLLSVLDRRLGFTFAPAITGLGAGANNAVSLWISLPLAFIVRQPLGPGQLRAHAAVALDVVFSEGISETTHESLSDRSLAAGGELSVGYAFTLPHGALAIATTYHLLPARVVATAELAHVFALRLGYTIDLL